MADSDSMSVYALNANFELIDIAIPYDNLQWTRRYYETGEFMMEVDVHVYNEDWAYIGTADRPELGIVQKINTRGIGDSSVLVSGLFLEGMLNDKACYPRYKAEADTAEEAARSIFERYKSDMFIVLGEMNDPPLGDPTQSDFTDEELADKLHAILERSELSYRCRYDYDENVAYFEVWQGVDRTSSQDENGYQTFSTQFGNIADREVNMDQSAYKNYAIVPVNANEDDVERDTLYIDWSDGGYRREIVFDYRSSRPEEDEDGNVKDYAGFKAGIIEDASERLMAYAMIEDVDVELMPNGGYMVDFDLGDKCDVILEDLGISIETRIVEVAEVFKAEGEGHSVTVGLGNKRVSNIRRLINRL